MKGVLIIFTLSIRSSYVNNSEIESDTRFDVLEWWITESKAYRIKTYSINNDIHVNSFEVVNMIESIELAYSNSKKHYGDVITASYEIEFDGQESIEEIQLKRRDLDLEGTIECGEILFWNPDNEEYSTKSRPS